MPIPHRPGLMMMLVALGSLLSSTGRAVGQEEGRPEDCCSLLLMPVGARSTALAGAIAAHRGPQALFRNPAGLAGLESESLWIHHSDLGVAGSVVDAFSAVLTPWGAGFGVTYQLFDLGMVETTDPQGNSVGELSFRNHLLLASLASEIGAGLSAGVSYKLYQERVDCRGDCTGLENAVTTHGADVGFLYSPPRRPEVQLGLSLLNAGLPVGDPAARRTRALPARVHVGASYDALSLLRSGGPSSLWLSLALQDELREPGSPTPSFGIELDMHQAIFLRAGYSPGRGLGSGAALGLGLRYGRLAVSLARTFANSAVEPQEEPFQVSLGLEL